MYSTVSTLNPFRPTSQQTFLLPGSDAAMATTAFLQRGFLHTDGGDSGDDFAKLQLIENRGLSGGVQPDHENSHLLLSP